MLILQLAGPPMSPTNTRNMRGPVQPIRRAPHNIDVASPKASPIGRLSYGQRTVCVYVFICICCNIHLLSTYIHIYSFLQTYVYIISITHYTYFLGVGLLDSLCLCLAIMCGIWPTTTMICSAASTKGCPLRCLKRIHCQGEST